MATCCRAAGEHCLHNSTILERLRFVARGEVVVGEWYEAQETDYACAQSLLTVHRAPSRAHLRFASWFDGFIDLHIKNDPGGLCSLWSRDVLVLKLKLPRCAQSVRLNLVCETVF